jgi:SNF2 family DNA or RNA helicase
MFRKHAALLNTVPQLDVLICDEGHRLKNVGGTKTIQALAQCRARRRIVLSGTPVQNDLDELFAVVSFVQPGYFGTLPEYKQTVSGPIVRASEPDSTVYQKEEGEKASAGLREKMSALMLRRTQADILSKSLPPRTDFVVYCGMTRSQREEYEQTVLRINR